jgi:uncharacterized ion transporter superfamily protein YfcC
MKPRMPPNLLLMLGFMALALLATWLIPAGAYETVTNAQGASSIIPGTYRPLPEVERLPPWAIATAIPRALGQAQAVIFFILLVGGAFGLLRHTGAIEAAMGQVLRRFGHQPTGLIVVGTLVFGFLSAFFGMASEYIALAGILAALCAAMRLDAVVASAILLVGYGIGYGASTTSPFSVVLAQDIAGVPPGSGLLFRCVVLAVALAIGVHHILAYRQRTAAREPFEVATSLTSATAPENRSTMEHAGDFPPMNAVRVRTLACLALTLVALLVGILVARWSLPQLSALFLGLAFTVAVVARIPATDACNAFIQGAARLTGTALLVGFARAIGLILEDGQVLHTIVHATSTPLQGLTPHVAAVCMLAMQSLLDVAISSGTGQAFATMPIMAPLGDVLGISRQTTVLAYQFGAGFIDMITPTNPFLLAILGVTGVGYGTWFRFIWPLIVKLLLMAAIVMVIAVETGF